MIAHRIVNWLLAMTIVGLYVLIAHLDEPGPAATEHATLASLQDARREQLQASHFELAARQLCGENAGWRLIDEHTIQCTTKRGFNTVKVHL